MQIFTTAGSDCWLTSAWAGSVSDYLSCLFYDRFQTLDH